MEKLKRENKKIISILILLFTIFISFSCVGFNYKISNKGNGKHRYMMLKINYKDDFQKYNGRIVLLKQNERTKIFFLNPIGRIYFKLLINGELTTAVYIKKKRFWEGKFSKFIYSFWRISIEFKEFYRIINQGIISDKLNNLYVFDMSKDRNKRRVIIIKDSNLFLKIKVIKNIIKTGNISFKLNKSKLKRVSLRELLKKE